MISSLFYSANNKILYNNQLVNGEWQHISAAVAVLETECSREWTQEEHQVFKQNIKNGVNNVNFSTLDIFGNQFRGGSDYQIEQCNDCARLIANGIIYYYAVIAEDK